MLRSVLQESSVFQQGGRKVTSEEGGLPVMCPRGGTLCQSPAGEGTKRGLCRDAAPQEVSSRNQLEDLRIAQSCPLSVSISQKSRSTGLMQPPMAWFGTTCLTD